MVEVEEDRVDGLPQRLIQRVHGGHLGAAALHVLQQHGQLDLALHQQLVDVRRHLRLQCEKGQGLKTCEISLEKLIIEYTYMYSLYMQSVL